MGWSKLSDPSEALWRADRNKKKKKKTANRGLDLTSAPVNPYADPPYYASSSARGYPSASDSNYYAANGPSGTPANAQSASLVNAYQQMYGQGSTTQGGTKPQLPPGTPNPGDGSGGTAPFDEWSGYAKDWTSGGMDILYDEPRVLIRDLMKKMGFNPDSGMIDLLAQDADTLQYLMMLTSGAQPDSSNSMTDENFINYTGDWAKNMTTPGAGAIDPNQMIQAILDAPEGSALAGLLSDGTPQEQAAMLNNLMGVATSGYMPLAQRAMMGVLEGRTDDWLAANAKGGKNTPLLSNWLQRGGNGVWG